MNSNRNFVSINKENDDYEPRVRSKRINSHHIRHKDFFPLREHNIPRKDSTKGKVHGMLYESFDKIRHDAYGNPIRKGSHNHKVTFIDTLYNKDLAQINLYEEEEEYREEEQKSKDLNQEGSNVKRSHKRRITPTQKYTIITKKEENPNKEDEDIITSEYRRKRSNSLENNARAKCQVCIIF